MQYLLSLVNINYYMYYKALPLYLKIFNAVLVSVIFYLYYLNFFPLQQNIQCSISSHFLINFYVCIIRMLLLYLKIFNAVLVLTC